MLTYEGSIEDVLSSGEYDCGDKVILDYDELADLVEQAKLFKVWWERELYAKCLHIKGTTPVEHIQNCDLVGDGVRYMEQKTNRPVHPCLGGESPYSEFLPV